MMEHSTTKVVFPPPPPTTNSLTVQQRNQLQRKAKKLEQILGVAPHLLDTSNSEPSGPVRGSLHQRRPSSISRRSIDSLASSSASSSCSSSSSGPLSHSIERVSTINSFSSTSSTPRRSLSRRPSSTLKKPNPSAATNHAYETWSHTKPPFLRVESLAEPNTSPGGQISWSASCPFPASKRYTISLPRPHSGSDSEDSRPPMFRISSMGCSSHRRSKMDRIRRKLGHGVPVDLVFPSADDAESVDHDSSSSSDESVPRGTGTKTPIIPRRRSSRKTRMLVGTIAGSRDSLTEHTLIHHAPRNSPSPVPALPRPDSTSDHSDSPPPLPPKPTRPLLLRPRTSTHSKAQLLAIIECPDEHGSGCSEEFGRSKSRSRSGSGSESSHQGLGREDYDELEIKLWSTRRGYEGWTPPVPAKPSSKRTRSSWGFSKK